MLRYARVTGDATALGAGEKALGFMERFRVPRGGQTWERPMYEPDIPAALTANGWSRQRHQFAATPDGGGMKNNSASTSARGTSEQPRRLKSFGAEKREHEQGLRRFHSFSSLNSSWTEEDDRREILRAKDGVEIPAWEESGRTIPE